MKPAITVLITYVPVEMVATHAPWYAQNVESIVTIATITSAVIVKHVRIVSKTMVGATTVTSAVTAFQISVFVEKAVLTA